MGLVVPDIVAANTIDVTAAVPEHTPNKVCTDGSSSSPFEEILSFDKSIYRVLNKQDDMKVLKVPTRVKTEFDLFLVEAEKKFVGLEYNTSFDSLDEYLGSLGVTNVIC